MKVRQTTSDRIVSIIIYIVLVLAALTCLYPLYLVLISSFSAPDEVGQGHVLLYPIGLTLNAYVEAFKTDSILVGYRNSLFYVIAGTVLNMLLTIPTAYSLSHPKVKGRGVIMKILL